MPINASEERRRRLHDRGSWTHETDDGALVRKDSESTSAQPDSSVGIVTSLPDGRSRRRGSITGRGKQLSSFRLADRHWRPAYNLFTVLGDRAAGA